MTDTNYTGKDYVRTLRKCAIIGYAYDNRGKDISDEYEFIIAQAFDEGVQQGKKLEWFNGTEVIPVPKSSKISRYSSEAISSTGDLVAYDYKLKSWVKLEINDDKIEYIPVKVEEWTNKPCKERYWEN